jgi:hypothetical protein
MLVEDANTLLQTFRRAVADTCQAKAVFNTHLTGSTEEYKAADKMLKRYLMAEAVAYVACQNAMLDCGCREREQGRAESICQAQQERALDFAEESAREVTP